MECCHYLCKSLKNVLNNFFFSTDFEIEEKKWECKIFYNIKDNFEILKSMVVQKSMWDGVRSKGLEICSPKLIHAYGMTFSSCTPLFLKF